MNASGMHPVIRILCLLAFAMLAPWLSGFALLFTTAAFLLLALLEPSIATALARGLRRVRWLLLSIVILYAWFTPGNAVWPALGVLSPNGTGVLLALERTMVLVVMVWAAMTVIVLTPTAELASALRLLLTWPIDTAIGRRFAARIGYLLAELPQVESSVRDRLQSGSERKFADSAAALFRSVESRAMDVTEAEIAPAALAPMPKSQLLWPLLVLAGGIALIVMGGSA